MKHVPPHPPSLNKPIIYSTVIHVIALVVLILLPGVRLPMHEKPIRIDLLWVELPRGVSDEIGPGMRRAKGLPKSTIEEQRRLFEPRQKPLEPMMREPVTKTKKRPKPRPRIKVRRERKIDRKIRRALAKLDRKIVPEAAQIKEGEDGYKYGTGTEPLRVAPTDPEYLKYQAMVRAKIIREWVVPLKYIEEKGEYNAQLLVMINLDGYVVSIRWEKPSGDATFDQSAIRAIKKASPFPKPLDRLAWEAYNEGFLVEFDPRLKPRY